jgi:hypothetical protein
MLQVIVSAMEWTTGNRDGDVVAVCLHTSHTGYGEHPASYSVGPGFFPWGQSGRDVKI